MQFSRLPFVLCLRGSGLSLEVGMYLLLLPFFAGHLMMRWSRSSPVLRLSMDNESCLQESKYLSLHFVSLRTLDNTFL